MFIIKQFHRFALVFFSLLTVITLTIHGTAFAMVLIENRMSGEFLTGNIEGTRAYEYGSGTDHLFDTDADFNSGVTDSNITVTGDTAVVNLDWWDEDWDKRQCFTVSTDTALGQYPFRVEVDTTGLTVDDIRVVEALLPANTATPVTHYTEGIVGAADSVVWFQGEGDPAGKEYCVYFDSGLTSTSDEIATFTYTNGQTIKYYPMLPSYNGAGTNGQVTVVSYSNNNTVSDGTSTVVLNTGQIHTFNGIDFNDVITATGPIDASNNTDQKEALLPEAFADSILVMPTNRSTQRFYVRSPNGNTTIEAIRDGVVISSTAVTPASGVVAIATDSGGSYVTLRSTNGAKFLASHIATQGHDSFHGVPWFGDDLYGVPSENFHIGSDSATTVNHYRHTGPSGAIAVPTSSLAAITGNGSGRGNGVAYRVEPTGGRVAAIQQRDDNGVESTSFLPERLLSATYRIPIPYHYFTVACPTVGTIVTINSVPQTCNGTGVGHVYSGLGTFPAGTLIEANHPIYVYYENTTGDNETNIYGAKASIPFAAATIVSDTVETFQECGTWTSPVFNTNDVLGLTEIEATLSTGGSYEYQIAFDGGAFLGPDGTASTFYDNGDFVDYAMDGSSTAQIRVELCGSGSVLDSVSFECDLVERFNGDAIAITEDAPVLRVYPNLVDSYIRYESSTAPDTYDVDVDVSSTHIQAVGGTVTNPAPVFASQPYSVLFENLSAQTSTLNATLVDEDSIAIETTFEFNIAT